MTKTGINSCRRRRCTTKDDGADDDGVVTPPVVPPVVIPPPVGSTAPVNTVLPLLTGDPTAIFIPANIVVPVVTGVLGVGQMLTCSTGTWTGTAPITFSYQWKVNGLNVGTNINTYTPVAADEGKIVTCAVTGTNVAGAATATTVGVTVPNSIPVNTITPNISGTQATGFIQTCTTGTWTGTAPITYSFAWFSDGVAVGTNSNQYTTVGGDSGHVITCVVTATNIAGSDTANSDQQPIAATAPANSVIPAISGSTPIGSTLTSTTGTWTGTQPITFAYQWKSAGVNVGSNQNTYVTQASDAGHAMTCAVTATNVAGNAVATSTSITVGGAVSNSVAPVISLNSGYAGHYSGSKYTTTQGTWVGGGTVTRNWQSNGVNIPGATGLTHTLTFAQEGLGLRCRETNSGITADSNVLTRPALSNLSIDTVAHAPPTADGRPAYLVPYTDPTFGTKITRISDNPGNAIGATAGVWGSRVHHQYHKFPVWNADETLMFIEDNSEGGSAGMIMLDGQTYQVVSFLGRPSGWREGRWDRLVPNRMVYVTTSSINYYNVTSGVTTLIRNFASTYNNMYIGALKGEQSWDNDIFPIKATRISDGANVVFPYTISTDTVGTVSVPETRWGHTMSLGQVSISPLKNYMVVYFDDETARVLDVTGTTDLNSWTTPQQPTHHTLCVDGNDGLEYAYGAYGGTVIKRRLSDGAMFDICVPSFPYHTSATNYQRGKWCTNDYVDDSSDPYLGEQILIAHNGTVAGRLCHNQRGVNIDYDNEPHGSLSPTGKRIIFASTWRGAGTPSRPVGVYVCDFRGFQLPGIG